MKPNCGFEKVEELVEAMDKLVYLGDDEKGVKCIKPTLYRVEDWEKAEQAIINATKEKGLNFYSSKVRANVL